MILSGGGRSGSRDARFEGEYQSMSLALCASAPSHPLHAMPPWITRNSDRLRASDRTMVDTQNQFSLAKFQDSIGVVTTRSMNLWGKNKQARSKPRAHRGARVSGLDLETKIFSFSGQGRSFFLTSLFIELIDHGEFRSKTEVVQKRASRRLLPANRLVGSRLSSLANKRRICYALARGSSNVHGCGQGSSRH